MTMTSTSKRIALLCLVTALLAGATAAGVFLEGSAEQIPIWAAWTLVGGLAVLAMLRGVSPAARRA